MMKRAACVLAFVAACKAVSSPTPAEIDAGEQAATGICSFIKAVDPSGILVTICATVDEVAAMVAYVLGTRSVPRAAASGFQVCEMLPGSDLCVTNAERLAAIQFVMRERARDAGKDGP